MPTAVSQPLSSSVRPAEAGRGRGRTRRTTWRRFAGATFLLVREKVNYHATTGHAGSRHGAPSGQAGTYPQVGG
eukprot:929447-Prymnesium_polylepis.1